MNFVIQFFYVTLYQPFFNGLILLYEYLPGHDFGLAVVILTALIKLALHPLTIKGLKAQRLMADLQPKIKEIQEKFKGDSSQQNKAMMELYKQTKVNPFSGCFLLLLQLPILVALYQVFLKVLSSESFNDILYGFVANPGAIQPHFLWVFDFNNKVFIGVLAVMAGLAQFWQSKISSPQPQSKTNKTKNQPDFSGLMQKQMLYLFPALGVFIVWKFGAVIGLYWIFTSVFSIIEQMIVNKKDYGQQKT